MTGMTSAGWQAVQFGLRTLPGYRLKGMHVHTDGYSIPSPTRTEIAVVTVQRRTLILKIEK
jgi:hypothetical protein